jgi:hypothetical protein
MVITFIILAPELPPNGAPYDSWSCPKRLNRHARGKRSSLFVWSVSNEDEKFENIDTRWKGETSMASSSFSGGLRTGGLEENSSKKKIFMSRTMSNHSSLPNRFFSRLMHHYKLVFILFKSFRLHFLNGQLY